MNARSMRPTPRRVRYGLGVLLALSGALASTAQAGEAAELRSWLDRMVRAMDTLNYQGTFVYWQDDHLEAMRIVHLVDEHGERERLVALNGSKREVIRENENVTCIFPDQDSVVDERITQRLFPAIPATDLDSLGSRYTFALGPRDRVAGLNAQAISIKPIDDFRYGYELWLEENTGMLLKSALLDADGEPVEQLMFTSIKLGAMIQPEELEPDVQPKQLVQRTAIKPANAGGVPAWKAADIPMGFRLSTHERSVTDQGDWMEHLIYSDGLASISVYVEPISAAGDYLNGASRIGIAHAFGRQTDDIQITVVGEVPAATVERLALSVQRAGLALSTP